MTGKRSDVIGYFKNLNITLNKPQQSLQKQLDDFLKPSIFRKKKQGFYIWGDVGRGKTMMMDGVCYNTHIRSLRMHYHQFFKNLYIHLRGFTNHRLGISQYAQTIAKNYDLLCLDEFHLHDLANGLLMEAFLKSVVKNKVKVILTSNYQPGYLMTDHHLKQRITPFIQFVEKNFSLFNLKGEKDYRTQDNTHHCDIYLSAKMPNHNQTIAQVFKITPFKKKQKHPFLFGTQTNVQYKDKEIIWFLMEEICAKPHSYLDYLELAENFKMVMVSGIEVSHLNDTNCLRRFIWLIDVLYDQQNHLRLVASENIFTMLKNTPYSNDLNRTISRLYQMQSFK